MDDDKPTTSTSEKPTSTDKPTASTSSDTSNPSSSNNTTTNKNPTFHTTSTTKKRFTSSDIDSSTTQHSPVDKGRSHHLSLWEKIKSFFSPRKEDQASSNEQVETPYHAVNAENSESNTGDSYDYHPGDTSNDTGEGEVGPEVNAGGRIDASFLDKVISIVK